MSQLEIPWAKKKAAFTPSKPKGSPYLVNSANANFRWHEPSDDAAIRRAQALAVYRQSTTTLYVEVDGKCGPRLASFDQKGERFQ